MLLALLITLRDALLAAALAWVGVTIEPRDTPAACSGEACQHQGE